MTAAVSPIARCGCARRWPSASEPAPPLEGAARADVAIVGGGFVGLWTAIRIKEHDPACDVVVLEQDVCGGGASGRNGGLVLSWWPKLSQPGEALRRGRGDPARRALPRTRSASSASSAQANGIDCHYVREGCLWTATAPAHVGVWEGVLRLARRTASTRSSAWSPPRSRAAPDRRRTWPACSSAAAATVQPALLARGLRRVALERGVRIHEHTRVTGFSRERPLAVRTDGALVAAEKLVVATNAWAAAAAASCTARWSSSRATSSRPRRSPIGWREIGWTGGEASPTRR